MVPRLEDPVETLSRAGIRSREAPGSRGSLRGPRVAAGLEVGRPITTAEISAAPDRLTAGDSRPPNATLILLELLRLPVGQRDAEGGACARHALHADAATVRLHDGGDYREAEAGTTVIARREGSPR